ncbi:MAG: hypothetical protein GXP46_13260 [Deferribacteres bacterium]|nr:hypothetical protein [Deferribacteres bacterium]
MLLAVWSLLFYSGCDDAYWGAAEVEAPPNNLPDIIIMSPLDGEIFTEGESITFSTSVYDVDEGAIMDNCKVWTSSIDGEIGRGAFFSRDDLSVGVHVITLTARDSEGDTASVSVRITINPVSGS